VIGPVVVILAMRGPWPGSQEPDADGFRDLVQSARTVERRRERGYHLSPEDIRRFSAASAGVERLARLHGTPLGSIRVEVLDRGDGRLVRPRAGYHLPEAAPDWLFGVAELLAEPSRTQARLAADSVRAAGHGLVLSPSPTVVAGQWTSEGEPAERATMRAEPAREVAAELRFEAPEWPAFAHSRERSSSADALWADLIAAVDSGEPLVVGSGARHEVITEVLNRACSLVPTPVPLRVLYADGSEAAPFLLQPPRVQAEARGRTLRVGLMSMRHTEVDLDVDGYWFRNRMVSTTRTLAETDAFCAAATAARLDAVAAAGVGRIEVVHTGFEPAVVGFYRGVLAHLNANRHPVQVQPVYLIGGHANGTRWGAA
jgi:hypothetical protein